MGIANKLRIGVYERLWTSELDELAAETSAAMTTFHPDYAILAARIAVTSLHKVTSKSFLMRVKNQVVERPQFMLMRVAIGIHMEDLKSAIKTYKAMSERWYTHATPTLFNA